MIREEPLTATNNKVTYREALPFWGVLCGLLTILYGPLLAHWYDGWLNKSISIEHEYFSHGLIGLPFAAYIVWEQRDHWAALPENRRFDPAQLFGLGLLGLGAILYLGRIPESVDLSLPVILAGLCLALKGWPGLKLQAFPLLLVFLSTPTPVPYLIEPYILPLQSFIASCAGYILRHTGLDITVSGIYLLVGNRTVEVAPHCAGLKMLFTSVYVSLMLLYWTGAWRNRSRWFLYSLSAAAISVIANILRNTALTFFHGTGQEAAFHWLHDGWGGDLYSAAMLGLLVVIVHGYEQWFPWQNASPNPQS
ncbi:cyanoexosortase B [Leptolyngbya sp. FACHB-261]|uniref:cyanoexosortase B n=1 Tax=Leptolyngbya sp. FACHB-261 TaxID=2692806 RepID=UPI0016826F47|nr:cyanoexosortase B [Leptolyngbya sp. FACHB-261]MBD2105025.1 cyanoexosortase B [Leptolyngbya sp. FACHB-261]